MPGLRLTACGAALLFVVLGGCAGSPQARRDKHLARGKDFLQKRDYARALLEFKNAGRAMPNDAEIFYQFGLAYSAAQDYRAAAAAFRKALALNPKHTGAQLRFAGLMALTNDQSLIEDAQSRLKALLDNGSISSDTLNILALTELKLGDADNATRTLERALTLFPGELTSFVILAKVKWDHNDAKGAEEALQKACRDLPKSADAHRTLGEFYLARKRLPEAEEQLLLALGLDPNNGQALRGLARLQLLTGRKQEAERSLQRLRGLRGYGAVYALFLFQDGRRDDAIREFERVARENAGDRQARTYLLAAYRAVNRTADVDRVLGEAFKKNPKDVEALLQRAEILIERGNYQQAETDLNTAGKLNPAAPEAHYIRARLNKARGATRSYRQELSETLRLSPAWLAVRLELAQDFIDSRDGQAALDVLDASLPFQKSAIPFLVTRNWALWTKGDLPEMRKGIDAGFSQQRNPDFLVQDGVWKLRTGNATGARAAVEEALKMAPANLSAIEALNATYVVQKNASLGLEKVKEYAARAPKSAPVQNFLGQLLLTKGDATQARAAFLAAKAGAPKTIETDLSLVQADYLERKYDDGRAKLQAILAANPGNLTARLWMGILEEKKGDHKAAIEHFRKTLAANPDDADAANNLAYLLAEYGNSLDEALKYAQTAVELAPGEPAYADSLGWILYRKGLYKMAIKYLEQASAHPETAVWKYHLAMAYAKAGDRPRSRTVLAAALKLNPNVPEAKAAQDVVRLSQ